MTDSDRNRRNPDDSVSAAKYRTILNESARLLRANRPGEAITLLEPLRADFPTDPDIAINMGGALILQRKWSKAISILRKAVESTPDNVLLWTNLAAAYLGRLETSGPKHQKRAISAYEEALRIDPSAPNVHYHLGLIYKQQDNLSRASALFQRAMEINPIDKDARYWMEKLSMMLVERERAASRNDAPAQSGHDRGAQQGRANGTRQPDGRPPTICEEELSE